MNRKIKLMLTAAGVCALMAGSLQAQDEFFRNGLQFGVGARAIAMGGAYGAVGDDYTASFWNPAALAQIRRFEFTGGLSRLSRENTAGFLDSSTVVDLNSTKLNELGFAYPVPTYRGSLVFSFGFNRVKTFGSNFALSDVYNSLPDDSVSQSWKEREDGGLNNWTIAGAIDLSPNFSAGIGMNFWSGNNDYQFTFVENDIDSIYTFNDFRRDDKINSEINGFNVTFGGLYRVNKALRLSATIATPTTLTITEKWETREKTTFDAEPDETYSPDEIYSDEGTTEYKIRSPFTFTAGAALNLAGLVTVSGQIEHNDWSQLSYRSDPPIADISQDEANDLIEERYQETQRIRLGAELTLPGTATQVHAGYILDPSPDKNDTEGDREYYSFGLGLLLDKQVKLDLAYVYGSWTENNAGLNDFVTSLNEDISVSKIFASVSVRF